MNDKIRCCCRRGPTGPQGVRGMRGDIGPMGYPGNVGIRGDTGDQGPVGIQGSQGPTGSVGEQGFTGPQGPEGPTGPIGNNGYTGPTGKRGFTGVHGVTGPAGKRGSTGPQGIQGFQGIQGSQGFLGLKGDNGPTGPKGDIGFDGPTGPQGLKGSNKPYIYVWTDIKQSIPLNSAIIWNNIGPNIGFVLSAPDTIRPLDSGIYFCTKTVDTLEPNAFALYINGIMAPGTWFGSNSTSQDVGQSLVRLNAGDLVSIVNKSSQGGTVTLSPLGSGSNLQTTAGFILFKIDSL